MSERSDEIPPSPPQASVQGMSERSDEIPGSEHLPAAALYGEAGRECQNFTAEPFSKNRQQVGMKLFGVHVGSVLYAIISQSHSSHISFILIIKALKHLESSSVT
jgi:hypothetical protein